MSPQFRTEPPKRDDYWELFQTTGWNEDYRLSPELLERSLERNWYSVAAYDHERLVGFGRVVSDGIMHAMIYDLIVSPEFQERGIGTQILDMLVRRCRGAGIFDVQLFCARGKRRYYEKRGFAARPDDAPGMEHRGVPR